MFKKADSVNDYHVLRALFWEVVIVMSAAACRQFFRLLLVFLFFPFSLRNGLFCDSPISGSARRSRFGKLGPIQILGRMELVLEEGLGQLVAGVDLDLLLDLDAHRLQPLDDSVLARRVEHPLFDGTIVAGHGVDEN